MAAGTGVVVAVWAVRAAAAAALRVTNGFTDGYMLRVTLVSGEDRTLLNSMALCMPHRVARDAVAPEKRAEAIVNGAVARA